jgi:hypothetical protein
LTSDDVKKWIRVAERELAFAAVDLERIEKQGLSTEQREKCVEFIRVRNEKLQSLRSTLEQLDGKCSDEVFFFSVFVSLGAISSLSRDRLLLALSLTTELTHSLARSSCCISQARIDTRVYNNNTRISSLMG